MSSGLVPREVTVEFDGVRADWNDVHPEFAHLTNAMSTMLPFMEPFFIKTMRAAKKQLPPGPSPLKRDIDLFNFQEARHYSNHARFNDVVRAGYSDLITAGEGRLKADYKRFSERGHKFALAYTEGFETVAPRLCHHLFRHAHRYGLDTGEPAAYLWLWHVAEEHEHRSVANAVYHELYGGYAYRVYGILAASWHVASYSLPLARKTLRIARRRMGFGERLRSRVRAATLLLELAASIAPHVLLRTMRPRYDPAVLEPPAVALELLDEARARFGTGTVVHRD